MELLISIYFHYFLISSYTIEPKLKAILKKQIIVFILIPFLAFAQWNYGKLNNEIGTYAVGDINFMGFDNFEFNFWEIFDQISY